MTTDTRTREAKTKAIAELQAEMVEALRTSPELFRYPSYGSEIPPTGPMIHLVAKAFAEKKGDPDPFLDVTSDIWQAAFRAVQQVDEEGEQPR